MLAFIASSCVRNARNISPRVSRLSAAFSAPTVGGQRSLPLLTPAARLRLPARSVSLSAPSPRDVESPESPPVPLENHEPHEDSFGYVSADFSSRRLYRKTNSEFRDLRPREEDHEEDGEEPVQRPRRPGRRNTTYWYFLQCKKLIKANKLQEALDLFSKNMLQEERLQPEEYNYSVLIGGCGRAGNLKKAFKLYNDLKKRGLHAEDAVYTALFNACAESPSKEAGLQHALKLEQELRRKNYPLSTITYHALLKTHAMTNHLQACIHTIREMLQNGHVITQVTFHYLLMGCLKDKESGFRLALQVWRQMLRSGIQPDSQNYNLLLRAARDCGIGNPTLATQLLLDSDWQSSSKKDKNAANGESASGHRVSVDIDLLEQQLLIQPGLQNEDKEDSFFGQDSTHLIPLKQEDDVSLPVDLADDSALPSLLDLFEGKRSAVFSLSVRNEASDRLALIGGAKGVLEKMTVNGLVPDLRTLTLLADTVQPSSQSLQILLKAAKEYRVKLDVAFFNSVIRRAARAGNLDEAKVVLKVMQQRYVEVNAQTFGSLALGCEKQKDGLQLLKDMEEAGFRPNIYVFSALIGRAVRRLDYVYLKTLLKIMKDMDVWPNELVIQKLEFAAQYPPDYNQYKSRNNYLVQIDGFRGYYQQWLKSMPALGTGEKQEEPQPAAKTETDDGLTISERNRRAAARRYYSRKKNKLSPTVSAV
ncbi:pentatricopeptide repeat-containing protein 1, mitochondrial [Thalassophryne amazonica]|uniref:pentatricopeptide repeat-containing protein 1, mitochondrial n=1 Tax=Thalassophryne amazonica TaxID=390379 RepID=UPI001472278A|nr:pentatricopeptide repeat-containing protein 1, mitochondrial [Thalassophryne amazonica]